MNQQGQQVQIRAKDEDLKGNYSNMMQVSHAQEEFVLDFFNVTSTPPAGVLSSRVIVSPGHFKRLIEALQDNLKKYEERFGEIKRVESPGQEIGFQPRQ